jgi:guanosine-3',5'-bis(diphosphate) 3'-pyrophosphohydrolase
MNPDLVLVLDAAAFAADKHRRQRRKDAEATPYINHPLALARILASEGGVSDAEVIAAALLHDTVEDTETTLAELEARFGSAVAAMVAEVTDDKALPKAERKRLQVARAAHKSPGAKLVKIADKIANLRDIAASPPADWDAARKADYVRWASEVVSGMRGTNAALEAAFDAAAAAFDQALTAAYAAVPSRRR